MARNIFVILSILIWTSYCEVQAGPSGKEAAMAIKVTSKAFKEGGEIPRKYTCDGDERNRLFLAPRQLELRAGSPCRFPVGFVQSAM